MKEAAKKSRIYFVTLSSGENNVFYAHKDITEAHIKKAYRVICEDEVVDIAEVGQDALQYYHIDGRVYCDTEAKKEKLFSKLREEATRR